MLLIGTGPGWGPGINYLIAGFHPIVYSNRVIFVTLQPRGTFPSGQPADETRMSSKHMGADIEGLRQHLTQTTINFKGHSNETAITIGFAEQFPAHCAKVILIETECIGFADHRSSLM